MDILIYNKENGVTFMYILPFSSIVFILALLLAPTTSITAAKTGLLLWFNTVLPSLLPFIIGSNLLLKSGSVYLFEKVFSPIMMPLFKVPGCCAFPWLMGLISGYPLGAKAATELRQSNQITDVQLQRLLSFCNNSGPFFIIGAVGVGMLTDSTIGYYLLAIHIISSIIVGIIFRFYGDDTDHQTITYKKTFQPGGSIGEVLGDSISDSMEVIVQVGGYIILFSVIGTLLKQTSVFIILTNTLHMILKPFGITIGLASSWILGIIEMSNGVSLIARLNQEPLTLAVISFILGWGGLSVHAQSLHFLKNTQIKTPLYLFAKLLHGVIAFILTLVLFQL